MDDILLENLTAKFGELFKNLRRLAEQRESVESENDHLRSLIAEEEEQLEQSDESSDDEEQLLQCQQKCQILLERKKESDYQAKEENHLKNQLYMHMETIQNEISTMKTNIEQQRDSENDLQQRIQDTTVKIDDYQQKIERAQSTLMTQEQQINNEMERNVAENDRLKQLQADVRQGLFTNSLADKRIVELEKIISKYWEELQKRTQRVGVLQNNQNLMQQKISKSVKSESIYNKVKDENTVLAQENIQIREKLNQLINALPNHMKKQKPKSKGKKEFLELYDESICSNQIKLRHLEKVRDEHQNNTMDLQLEIQQLEDKYNQMTSNIKCLQEQYFQFESSAREFNEEEYVKNNCPNFYKVKKAK